MRQGKFIALHESGICVAVVGLMLIAFPAFSAKAEQSPRAGCRAVSKIEYNAAKNQHLLRNRFGMYVRMGRVWRRYYWYCH
jgi:hypothetical protein